MPAGQPANPAAARRQYFRKSASTEQVFVKTPCFARAAILNMKPSEIAKQIELREFTATTNLFAICATLQDFLKIFSWCNLVAGAPHRLSALPDVQKYIKNADTLATKN